MMEISLPPYQTGVESGRLQMTNIEEVRRQPWLSANQNQSEPSDMLQISQHMPGSARSGESLHVGDGGQTARSQGPLFGRDCSSPLPPSRPYPQSSRMVRHISINWM